MAAPKLSIPLPGKDSCTPTKNPAWPYTPEQLKTIAQLLKRPEEDKLVRVVVGIARDFCKQQQPEGAKTSGKQKSEADAANKAAKAVRTVIQSPLPLKMFSIKLAEMRRRDELAYVERRLREFAHNRISEGSNPDGKSHAGRKPSTDHVVVAIARLIWIWKQARPERRGRVKLLNAALEPLGYDISKSVFKHHLKKASSLVLHH
jgi:hypothetical protein